MCLTNTNSGHFNEIWPCALHSLELSPDTAQLEKRETALEETFNLNLTKDLQVKYDVLWKQAQILFLVILPQMSFCGLPTE